MANSITHAALPYPIRGARYSLIIPYLDADGDPTDPTTPDTEVSKDAGAYADAAEEVTTITGSNGTGYITLTGAETDAALIAIAAKVASGPKATLLEVRPRELPILESGTAQAGAAGTITLASGAAAYDITGCIVKTTGGTGGGGAGGANNQARVVAAYNTSTKVATLSENWETTPDATTTYDVLVPDGMALGALKALAPTTLGRTLTVESDGMGHADLKEWLGVAPLALTAQRVEALLGAIAAGVDLSATMKASVATAVLDDPAASHVVAASVGERIERLDIILAGGAGELTAARAALLSNADALTSSRLAPTVAGRTLDVTAGGEAGLDLDNTVGTLAKTTDITGFNDLSSAQVNAEVDSALDTAIPASPTANSVNERLRDVDDALILRRNTAQAGTPSTMTLDAGASATDNFYKGVLFMIVGGTGAGQPAHMCTSYVGLTKVATFADGSVGWQTTPDSTSVFIAYLPTLSTLILWQHDLPNSLTTGHVPADTRLWLGSTPNALVSGRLPADVQFWRGSQANVMISGRPDVDVGAMQANVLTAAAINAAAFTAAKFGAGAIDAAALAADAGNEIADAILTRQMTEDYAADGVAPTVAQALFGIQQFLHEKAIASTTLTVKKLNGSTTAMTFTLNDATNPTSITRAT